MNMIGGRHLDPESIIAISRELQKAFDAKDIEKVLEFYHPDIVLVSPSSNSPVIGLDELRKAISAQFESAQRTSVSIREIKTYSISGGVMAAVSEIRGQQSIYYSTYRFNGLMTRIFVDTDDGPRIVSEHFSLIRD